MKAPYVYSALMRFLEKHSGLRTVLFFLMMPLFVAIGFFVTSDYFSRSAADSRALTPAVAEPVLPMEQAYPYELKAGSSLYATLKGLGVSSPTIHQIVLGARPIANLGQLRPGTRFQLVRDVPGSGEISEVSFRFSPVEKIRVFKQNEIWTAQKEKVTVETRLVTFRGSVQTSLWESALSAKMDPNLTVELAEIFAWQVDFAREVRSGDRWRLSVEQKFVRGRPYGWGKILAAEYENAGDLYSAVLFRSGGEDLGYFAPDGSSLRRMFLKSPIKFGRISSRFQRRRFHPILKINRPHLGVDYAAPRGTPIRAVGDGVVTLAAWRGGGGKTILIRHNSVYKTAYKHLSGFAKGVRSGAKIKQGQIIGYVGSTGLSTGPHLHFEFYRSGRFVDPLGQKFPSADPVPVELLTQFKSGLPSAMSGLPKWEGGVAVSMRELSSTEESPDGEAL